MVCFAWIKSHFQTCAPEPDTLKETYPGVLIWLRADKVHNPAGKLFIYGCFRRFHLPGFDLHCCRSNIIKQSDGTFPHYFGDCVIGTPDFLVVQFLYEKNGHGLESFSGGLLSLDTLLQETRYHRHSFPVIPFVVAQQSSGPQNC
jgi:hypothetical protein